LSNLERTTLERLRVLTLVDELASRNEFGVAPIRDLIRQTVTQKKVTEMAVRKMVWELSRSGYLENPIRGCWRLTDKARELLKSFGKDVTKQ
jgi:hypothetical protein